MAEYFKEPQNPLKKIDEKTGDITYVYPMTTAKQVIMDDDGTRLNTILNENILYLGDAEDGMNVAPVDADTLGGIPASEYALKGQGGGGGAATSGVKINLDGAIASGQPVAVDADTLGGVNASEYITRDELEEGNMDLLWTNPSPSSAFEAQTISLDLTNYKQVLIEFMLVAHDPWFMNSVTVDVGENVIMTCGYGNGSTVVSRYRTGKVVSTGIQFHSGYEASPSKDSVVDTCAVPYKIYGIKDTSIVSGGNVGGGDITVNLNGAGQSGQPSTVNADLLGGIAAEEYTTTEYVDNKTGMDLLWTNPDTSVAFNETTLNISRKPYRRLHFIFIYAAAPSGISFFTMDVVENNNYRAMRPGGKIAHRMFNVNDNTIFFDDCGELQTYGGDWVYGGAYNVGCVPYKIYGIK